MNSADTPDLPPLRPTVATVDATAIAANVAQLRRVAGVDVCAVIKADGYGHGALTAARGALAGGATWLAVALVEEAEVLRDAGITAPLILLAEPLADRVERLIAADLTPMCWTPAFLESVAEVGRQRGAPVDVHLKADTGMHRVGIPRGQWGEVLDLAAGLDGVTVTGLCTHLARADEPGVDTTDRQLDAFDDFIAAAAARGIRPSIVHAANSAGALLHPRARHSLVRAGIAIYGLSPSDQVLAADHDLVPALRWTTRVSFAKRIDKGSEVSYGHRWAAPDDGWLATLPVGYADGVPRLVGGRLDVIVGGTRRPIVGTVCMDQLLVWCGQDEVAVGDPVTLLGTDGDCVVSADDWAAAAQTITYEITCGISARVPRLPIGVD